MSIEVSGRAVQPPMLLSTMDASAVLYAARPDAHCHPPLRSAVPNGETTAILMKACPPFYDGTNRLGPPQEKTIASSPTSDGSTVPKALAATLAAAAFVVPYALSRSTTPSPDHPRVFFWYRFLRQPVIKPPDIAIPLAWLGIESGLAYAAYRLLRSPPAPARTRALAWLAGNVVGIGGWSRLFFGGRNLPVSTAAAAALAGASVAYVNEARRVDEPAAVASVPLVVWVTFATVLTAAIWRKNR